ncbi:GTP pyrophosphokinase [Methylophilus medardicus]|uniref:RelA/SpoT family protein n=1 Tax=Methylophilus medardicus TaxID=2588534 RepID=A0A5B8CTC4_9PROT|nr:RelA/SpoT domain-containing protein [Methylophilus medardicus]QDC44584.1 RelA/SpoT family protein [Methylophilus medardicus]QDC49591.1 RelA/SpoT family protein [Methylophilus medardicus]QDC53296.1 RelA/SpoT family protein [Methylophilus medardicus]
MTEDQFRKRWDTEKPVYQAWADFIKHNIEQALAASIAPTTLDYFLKIPVKPRLKLESTLIDKAFHRKQYQNPYDDVQDKVGMRFVVLLTSDIKKVCQVIESEESKKFWVFSRDRDYEIERLAKPLEFTYQSVHFVLKATAGNVFGGINILEHTPCEVQIRTLLQHAHSELTHDTIYKPKTTAQPGVKRTVAKSMALIEATDEFFEKAMQDIEEALKPQNDILNLLKKIYTDNVGTGVGDEQSNQLLTDTYIDLLQAPDVGEKISKFLEEKSFIYKRVNERRASKHLFSQPGILLSYYLASKNPAQTRGLWPFEIDDLALIFSDLGDRMPD